MHVTTAIAYTCLGNLYFPQVQSEHLFSTKINKQLIVKYTFFQMIALKHSF